MERGRHLEEHQLIHQILYTFNHQQGRRFLSFHIIHELH